MQIAQERIEARENQDPQLWIFQGQTETHLTALEEQQDQSKFLGVLQNELDEGCCCCGEEGGLVCGAVPPLWTI